MLAFCAGLGTVRLQHSLLTLLMRPPASAGENRRTKRISRLPESDLVLASSLNWGWRFEIHWRGLLKFVVDFGFLTFRAKIFFAGTENLRD